MKLMLFVLCLGTLELKLPILKLKNLVLLLPKILLWQCLSVLEMKLAFLSAKKHIFGDFFAHCLYTNAASGQYDRNRDRVRLKSAFAAVDSERPSVVVGGVNIF